MVNGRIYCRGLNKFECTSIRSPICNMAMAAMVSDTSNVHQVLILMVVYSRPQEAGRGEAIYHIGFVK